MPDAHPSGTILPTATPGKESAGRGLSFLAVSHEDPPGKPTLRPIYWLRGHRNSRWRRPPSVYAVDAGEVRRDEVNALLPGALSHVSGRRRKHRPVLPQALAGDTGAFLVPAEARAARPTWPAEFRGQYTGIKAIGAGLRMYNGAIRGWEGYSGGCVEVQGNYG